MILSLKALAAAGLAASVATGGAIATRTPSGNQLPAATAAPAAPADVLTTLAVGEEARFSAADAGEVVVVRTADGLAVKTVTPAAGWLLEVEEATGPEIEVRFVANGRRVDLNVELEDGSIRVRVRQRFDDDDRLVGDNDTTTSTTPTTFEDRDDDDGITTSTTFEERDGDDNSGPGGGDDDHSGSGHRGDDDH